MTGPVPPGGEELRERLAAALPESLGPAGLRRPAIPALGVEESITGFGAMVLDALLPTVLSSAADEGRRRAAEELRDRAAMILTRAAEEDEDVDAALTETAAWLAARAAALAPENARPE